MFFKNKVRVITAGEQTDFTERFEALDKIREESKYATHKDVLIMSGIPTVGAVGLFAYNKAANTLLVANSAATVQSIQQPIQAPVEHITPLVDSYSSITIPVNASVQKTGLIADTSLEMLATNTRSSHTNISSNIVPDSQRNNGWGLLLFYDRKR
ncbi:hypothetical protein AAGS61_03120 [Lysinibacillus sp. KU-BSD001]|uniref:hypothetical protein n=1 Tax=Lysinibacillus sp. KU-BSD001 TaxID=3141328 RepID=UPI0036ECA5EE